MILLVATTTTTITVERVFSSINVMKIQLYNQIGDNWMNESLIVYVEKEILDKIENEAIMQWFQSMKFCREQL